MITIWQGGISALLKKKKQEKNYNQKTTKTNIREKS